MKRGGRPPGTLAFDTFPGVVSGAQTEQPRLSVLMPVFNEALTVERALSTTLAADIGCPFELVVVDDGSTDGTRELLCGLEESLPMT